MLTLQGTDNITWTFSFDKQRNQYRVHACCTNRSAFPSKLMFTGSSYWDVLSACWEVRKTMRYADIKNWEYHYV